MLVLQIILSLVSLWLSVIAFRDLADISQWIVRTDRRKTMKTFYNRHKIVCAAIVLSTVAGAFALYGNSTGQIIWLALSGLSYFLIFMGYINPSLMMRAQQNSPRYYTIEEAKPHLTVDTSLIVFEGTQGAFGYPDRHILRPHVAGVPQSENDAVMTYCGLTNMGIAYEARIQDKKLELGVMTQLENNLVLWDKKSGEPIQQFWGTMERDGKMGPRMKELPSYRMPLWAFEKEFPEGKVFLNLFPAFWKSPFYAIIDRITNLIFAHAVDEQARESKPTFPTIEHFDTRLPNKAKIYGGNIGSTYFVVTLEHIQANDDLLSISVEGSIVVIAYHPELHSVGMYVNLTGKKASRVEFGGRSNVGDLQRLETMKSQAFWVVWQNFYPNTIVNPADGDSLSIGNIEKRDTSSRRVKASI